ncbi:MAG: hypothetical protein H0Z40_06440 [Desulfotomaculum sp.]|nr:hypothetical protein [Desulfotomaculum sp.]
MFDIRQFASGQGKHSVTIIATVTPDGLVIQVLGGEQPHVGAVVMTIPRPSLSDEKNISSNSFVLPRLAHKDDELARPVAEKLARYYNVPVVVVAGVHIDNASPADIEQIIMNCNRAVDKMMAELILP